MGTSNSVPAEGSVVHLISTPLLWRRPNAIWDTVRPLKYREEERVILTAMEESRMAFRWRQGFATVRGFYRLLREKCDVLHFTGHGLQCCILFEHKAGLALEVTRELLAELLENATTPKLVFVSACHSESFAEVFIGAGIRHVIAIASEEDVLESHANMFAEQFYEYLFSGETVRLSFDVACSRVRSHYPDTADNFRLLPEEEDHDVPIFRNLAVGEILMIQRAPTLQEGRLMNLPPPCNPFVGRQRYVQSIFKILVGAREEGSIIQIIGPKGIGKSQIALAVAQYAEPRGTVSHVYYISYRPHPPDDLEPNASLVFGEVLGLGHCPDAATLAKELMKIFGASRFKPLLILDNVDDWSRGTAAHSFRQMLTQLTKIRNLRIIITSGAEMLVPETGNLKVKEVEGLLRKDAAKLFVCSMPRDDVTPRKLCEGGEGLSREEAMEKFSKSEIMARTRYNPKVIVSLARDMGSCFDLIDDREEIVRLGEKKYQQIVHRHGRSASQISASDGSFLQRASSFQSPESMAWRRSVSSVEDRGLGSSHRSAAPSYRTRSSLPTPVAVGDVHAADANATAALQSGEEENLLQRSSESDGGNSQRSASRGASQAESVGGATPGFSRVSSLSITGTAITIDELEDPYDQALLDGCDSGHVTWGSLQRYIQVKVKDRLSGMADRLLKDSDFDYLAGVSIWWQHKCPHSDDDEVDRDTWKSFRKYLKGALYALQMTTLWEARTPSGEWLLEPFTDNARLVAILEDKSRPIGDSLITISKSGKYNTLVIIYKIENGQKYVRVTIERYGHAVKILDHENGSTIVEYESFQSLVLENDDITHINGVRKYDVFDPEEDDEACAVDACEAVTYDTKEAGRRSSPGADGGSGESESAGG